MYSTFVLTLTINLFIMKKQLLFIIALTITTATTFGQMSVSSVVGEYTMLASNIPNHSVTSTTPDDVARAIEGGDPLAMIDWTGGGADSAFRQLRDINGTIDDINGSYSFDVVTSEASANAIITVEFRKMRANTGTVTISINGSIVYSEAQPVDSGTATGYQSKTFTTNSLVLSSTPTTVLIEFVDITKNTTTRTGVRVYDAVVNVTETLSNDNINKNTTDISLYPNPATDSFKVQSNDAITNISVYSLNGQLVKSFTESDSYDVSNLATGLYSVRITTAAGSKTVKLIKK